MWVTGLFYHFVAVNNMFAFAQTALVDPILHSLSIQGVKVVVVIREKKQFPEQTYWVIY